MGIADALEIVEDYLSKQEAEMNNFGSALPGYKNPGIKLKVLNEHTQSHDFGWVFFYNSAKYVDTGDHRETLLGNAPLIFDKRSKVIVVTGTAHEVSYYVNNYIRTGDPHHRYRWWKWRIKLF